MSKDINKIPEGPNKLQDDIEIFKANLHNQIELFKVSAQITKIKFDAFKEAGFNDEQALRLCFEYKL